jgi:small subunit ribosomal protein S13
MGCGWDEDENEGKLFKRHAVSIRCCRPGAALEVTSVASQGKGTRAQKADFKYIVRLANTDLDGNRTIVHAMMDLKGVGSRVGEIIADRLKLPRSEKIGNLPDEKIEELAKMLMELHTFVPRWALNRQRDFFTGESYQVVGSDLELARREDINRMKMVRCYRGIRHEQGQKVRGQRTRSNGRSGLTVGVIKKAAKAAAAEAEKKKEEK